MLRSQVITLNVVYDDSKEGFSSAPALWHWTALLSRCGIERSAVEVLASGQWKEHDHPDLRISEEDW